ncbi:MULTISPECIES: hypothetical protein [Pseudoalteromonas]|uniref:hypothetical protein n=1 Tax=Pseudoalteromonas TaxID=53246 RepID=UPI00056C6760|nr:MULTISPECIES: hypothetical protein [Pseudoalteromonas]
MNIIKKKLLTISSFSLVACMATQPPIIKLESNEIYEFDSNASFALNVANMTRKTAGLSDVDLPEDAQFKSNGVLVGTEYALSFLTGGLVDLAGSLGAQSEADRAFNWKPMLVFLADIDEQNVDASVVTTVESELTKTFDNMDNANFLGLARVAADHHDNNFILIFNGEMCDSADTPKIDYQKAKTAGNILNLKPEYNNACEIQVSVEATGKVNYNNNVKSVITTTLLSDYQFASPITIATSGFAVVPQSFSTWGSSTVYKVSAPFVAFEDTMYFFTKQNSSMKIK